MNKYYLLLVILAIGVASVFGYLNNKKEDELSVSLNRISALEELVDVYYYTVEHPGEKLDSISSKVLNELPEDLRIHSDHILSFIERLMTDADTTDFQTLYFQKKTTLDRLSLKLKESEDKHRKIEEQLEGVVDSFVVKQQKLEETIRDKERLLQKKNSSVDSLMAQIKLQEKNKKDLLKFKSPSGTPITYFGEVSNGKAHGFGIGLYSSGSKYEGDWKYGYKHGEGTYEYPDGERYVGNFEADKRNGMGKYYWPNGDVYQGYWQADKRHGEGLIKDKSGKIVSSGIWKNDVLEKTADINF